jgi:hypothetical protein
MSGIRRTRPQEEKLGMSPDWKKGFLKLIRCLFIDEKA